MRYVSLGLGDVHVAAGSMINDLVPYLLNVYSHSPCAQFVHLMIN